MSPPFVQGRFEDLPEQPRLAHGWFDVPERRVHVWTDHFGDTEASVRVAGSGPPLLLVHGLMTTGYSWRYAWAGLARHHTVYMPDLVGSGRSSKPARRYPARELADWLAALVDALQIRGCDAVGNSMGGMLTLWLALRHPAALRSLLVVHAPGPPTGRLWALWPAIRAPGAAAALASWVRRDPLRWAHRQVHYWDESLKSLEEAREYGAPLATPEGAAAFVAHLRDGMDVRELGLLVAALRARRDQGCSFPVPLRLLYARQDPMVPPVVGRRLAALVPEAELRWLEEASHFAHVDAAERFLVEAEAWRARLQGPGRGGALRG